MLAWVSRLLRKPKPQARLIRAKYDAAQTTAENQRHWANADALSANAANSAAVRTTLRNRTRYEVANNAYAAGIAQTLANYTIGTGPRLQMRLDNEEANRQIERLWIKWARQIRLAEKLRTMRIARAVDGEAFALLITNGRIGPVSLDLRLIEADQVTDQTLLPEQEVDGILFDSAGNPVEYHVLKDHPGALRWNPTLDVERVPAEAMIHWFRADRPGQARGIPEFTPVLGLFAQLRRYTMAVLGAAETAASFAAVLYTDLPPANGVEDAEAWEEIPLERSGLLTVPAGWKIAQLQAEQPSTTYPDFVRQLLQEIGRAFGMPPGIVMGNFSGYNYASGRLDLQVFLRAIRGTQAEIERIVLDRLLEAWFDEAVLVPNLLPENLGPVDDLPHQWFWDAVPHVDPQAEANAAATLLAVNATTLAQEYGKLGFDWEEALRQRAKEKALMRELGLDAGGVGVVQDQQEQPDGEDQNATA